GPTALRRRDRSWPSRGGANLAALASALDGGAGSDTLLVDVSTAAALGGATGFETLIKQGVGKFTIDGPADSVFETVLVRAGELAVSAGALVDPQTTEIEAGATLSVDGLYNGTAGADTFLLQGTLAGTGTIDLLDGDDALTIVNGATVTLSGLFDAGAGTDSLVLAGDAGEDTFDQSQVGALYLGFETFRKEGAGVWRLLGAREGDWTVASGTLVGDSTTFGGDIDNAGTVIFDQAVDGSYAGVIEGAGALVKDNAGVLVLSGDSTFSGTTEIAAGALQVDGVLPGALSIAPGALLSGAGRVGSVTAPDGALVMPGSSGTPCAALTVGGDYAGGATVLLHPVLGDDSSATSRLVIEGGTSGSSPVLVTRAGGDGARTTGDGIRIIEVDGESAADSFALAQPVQA